MYSANVLARLPLLMSSPATLFDGHSVTDFATPAFVASALIAAGVMSGVPTMYSFFKLLLTVLRPLKPITIAVTPNAIRTNAATKPPISNTLRISASLADTGLLLGGRFAAIAVSGIGPEPRSDCGLLPS